MKINCELHPLSVHLSCIRKIMCTVLAFTSYIFNTTYIYMKLDLPQHSNLPHSHDRSDFSLAQTPDTHPYSSSLCSGVWTHYRLKQATEDNRTVSYTYCNTNVNISKNNMYNFRSDCHYSLEPLIRCKSMIIILSRTLLCNYDI